MDHAAEIDLLDGADRTLAVLQVGEWEAMVGGGPERFILTATAGEAVANALTSDGEDCFADDTIDLTVGGQAVDYPVKYALRRSELASALHELAGIRPGASLPDGRWEQ